MTKIYNSISKKCGFQKLCSQTEPILSFYFAKVFYLFKTKVYSNSSRLLVRCGGSQQYPRKLSTKKISSFFIDCLHSSYNIFYERTGTIDSKSETPIPRLPHFQGFVEQ
jgi:hypothetical protein